MKRGSYPMPKKLKKIPMSTVAYIQIEGEAVRDANDKQMIVQYAYSKIEMIDWYCELLNTGSRKYIIPHSIEYLDGIKSQIMDAIKVIMDRPTPKPGDSFFTVTYPKDYEG